MVTLLKKTLKGRKVKYRVNENLKIHEERNAELGNNQYENTIFRQ